MSNLNISDTNLLQERSSSLLSSYKSIKIEKKDFENELLDDQYLKTPSDYNCNP